MFAIIEYPSLQKKFQVKRTTSDEIKPLILYLAAKV
jgi:hypothetical protein